jgi:DNA-binding response OmpR family regulator
MGKSIVIIDDDCIIQDSLQEFFSADGYTVHLAADGISGLELVAREKPDVVVVDILLPKMHGIALCEKIKADADLRDIPIILMTGVYKDTNLRLYVHKGLAVDFIEKPFQPKDLLGKIELLLCRSIQIEPTPEAMEIPVPERKQKERTGKSLEQELDELLKLVRGKNKK